MKRHLIISCLCAVIFSVFVCPGYGWDDVSWPPSPRIEDKDTLLKLKRLEVLLHAKAEDRVLELMGYPTTYYTFRGRPVWYYRTLYNVSPLKNVYILFSNGRVREIRLLPSQLNPFFDFESL
jgi:hypothetical protein